MLRTYTRKNACKDLLKERTEIDDIFCCHNWDDGCFVKINPICFFELKKKYSLNLSNAILSGMIDVILRQERLAGCICRMVDEKYSFGCCQRIVSLEKRRRYMIISKTPLRASFFGGDRFFRLPMKTVRWVMVQLLAQH